ncbi:MAG: hypothetical protein HRU43_04680, partial [Simkaniaceae bacterium]|nr:hypothetical protein [Simkaniaceae bacterium]
MADNKPTDISKPPNIDPLKSIQPGEQDQSKPAGDFQSFMQEGQGSQAGKTAAQGPSPMELAGAEKQTSMTGPSHESISN